MYLTCLFLFLAEQSGIGLVTDGQPGCSLPNGSGLRRRCLRDSLMGIKCPLHISSSSSSMMLWARGFERHGRRVAGFLVAPITSVGHEDLALNLVCTLLSMPLGFHQFHFILTGGSGWCWMNVLVLLGFTLGLRAARVPRRRQLPHPP